MSRSQLSAADAAVISDHYRDQLVKSVGKLFDCFPMERLTRMLSTLSYFAVNPENSKDLEADSIKEMLTDCIEFTCSMAEVSDNLCYYRHE